MGRSRARTTTASDSSRTCCNASPRGVRTRGRRWSIGAGGGARAVVYALAERGARDIRVVNRTLARAEALAREFGTPVKAIAWYDRGRALEGANLLVNTTSQGMVGQSPLDLSLDTLPDQRDRQRYRLRTLGNAAACRGPTARQSNGGRPGHAAAPGAARMEGVVRH